MITTLALVPATPLLIPEVAGQAAGELDALRGASIDSVRRAIEGVERVVVLGGGAGAAQYDEVAGTLAPLGLDFRVGWPVDGAPNPPLPLLIGRWLVEHAGWSGGVSGQCIGREPLSGESLGLPAVASHDRVAFVIVVNGSARRSAAAPGAFDPRSTAFDDAWLGALSSGQPAELQSLSATLAEELMADGVTELNWLAPALGATAWSVDELVTDDRYGVLYATTCWKRQS